MVHVSETETFSHRLQLLKMAQTWPNEASQRRGLATDPDCAASSSQALDC